MATNAEAFLSAALLLVLALVLLYARGFLSEYIISRLVGANERIRKSISIGVGMQNSVPATALARGHFAASREAAFSGAASATINSMRKSLLAASWKYWDRWKRKKNCSLKKPFADAAK